MVIFCYRCSYGIRATAPLTPLACALRNELYCAPYHSINWDAQRNNCASIDLYAPHTVSDAALNSMTIPVLNVLPLE